MLPATAAAWAACGLPTVNCNSGSQAEGFALVDDDPVVLGGIARGHVRQLIDGEALGKETPQLPASALLSNSPALDCMQRVYEKAYFRLSDDTSRPGMTWDRDDFSHAF
jgi:hypothetical protein